LIAVERVALSTEVRTEIIRSELANRVGLAASLNELGSSGLICAWWHEAVYASCGWDFAIVTSI
jgi:hypothetical protein